MHRRRRAPPGRWRRRRRARSRSARSERWRTSAFAQPVVGSVETQVPPIASRPTASPVGRVGDRRDLEVRLRARWSRRPGAVSSRSRSTGTPPGSGPPGRGRRTDRRWPSPPSRRRDRSRGRPGGPAPGTRPAGHPRAERHRDRRRHRLEGGAVEDPGEGRGQQWARGPDGGAVRADRRSTRRRIPRRPRSSGTSRRRSRAGIHSLRRAGTPSGRELWWRARW